MTEQDLVLVGREDFLVKLLGSSVNLRVVEAMQRTGEATLYKIIKKSKIPYCNGRTRRRIRECLESLVALNLVEKRIILVPPRRHRLQNLPGRPQIYYRLNLANPVTNKLRALLNEITATEVHD